MIKLYDVPNKIETAVNYAYENIPYYNHLFTSFVNKKVHMRELPTTTKDDIVNSKYHHYLLPKDLTNISYGHSSGTTGKMTYIFFDKLEQKHSLQELWYYRLKWYGVSPEKGKFLYFFPTPKQELSKRITKTTIALSKSFLLSNNKIANACKLINQYKPKYAILQPSVIPLLYQVCHKYLGNMQFPFIEYIEFNGEFLEPAVEELTLKIFPNAQIANQYGLQEIQSVAYRCPYGHMHIMKNNCFVEIINQDKAGIGDICITSLQNHVMPYVRFITGDKGKFEENINCQCGCRNIVLDIKRGRDNDYVLRPNGNKLHPYLLLQLIENITKELIQYRITQTDYNSFTFELVVAPNVDKKNIEKRIKSFLENNYLYCPVELNFIYYDNLFPNRKTGKQTVFINQMEDKNVI